MRAYFATADLGLLPSWFVGESHPLALLECLSVGRPFLATDIGDVREMLTTPLGLAGTVVPLDQGRLIVSDLTDAIVHYAEHRQLLTQHTECALKAMADSSNEDFVSAHHRFYQRALEKTG